MNIQPHPHSGDPTRPREPGGTPPSLTPSLATVHAGGREIPYLRVGRGPSLVLLALRAPDSRLLRDIPGTGSDREGGAWRPGTDPDLHLGAALQALTGSFRVLVPLVSPPGTPHEGEQWIRDLIDGLGLDRPALVAPAELAPLLLRMIRRDPTRVGPCLLIPSDAGAPNSPFGASGIAILRAFSVAPSAP